MQRQNLCLAFPALATGSLPLHYVESSEIMCVGGGGVLSHVQLFATLWTITHQTPLSMGIFRQESWDGLPFPPPGDLPDPGIKSMCPASPVLQADSLPGEASEKPSSE